MKFIHLILFFSLINFLLLLILFSREVPEVKYYPVNITYSNNQFKAQNQKITKTYRYNPIKSQNCPELPLTDSQKQTLSTVIEFARPYNLVNTMTAIALQESSFDNSAINPKSGALGLGQILPATAKAIAIKRNEFISLEDISNKLTSDIHLNLTYMLDVIQYFTKVNQSSGYIDHNKVWLGYYSGHAYDGSTGYDKDIVKNIKLLKQCGYI